MRTWILASAASAAAVLAGCAGQPLHFDSIPLAEQPIICKGAQQCGDMWRRTQYWISTNSGFKIQTATDTVIETYNAPDYSLRWAFSARKEPMGNGEERITVHPNCGRAPICRESATSMAGAAKDYITALP